MPLHEPPRSLTFSPTPEQAAEIFERLAACYGSLDTIAAAYDTTLEALTLWLDSPETSARLDALHQSAIRRVRFAAASNLNIVLQALLAQITNYTEEERKIPFARTLDVLNTRDRHRTSCRRACTLFSQLVNAQIKPLRAPIPRERPRRSASSEPLAQSGSSTIDPTQLIAPQARIQQPLPPGRAPLERFDRAPDEVRGFSDPAQASLSARHAQPGISPATPPRPARPPPGLRA
jgi:hypothetical protein